MSISDVFSPTVKIDVNTIAVIEIPKKAYSIMVTPFSDWIFMRIFRVISRASMDNLILKKMYDIAFLPCIGLAFLPIVVSKGWPFFYGLSYCVLKKNIYKCM